VSNLQQRFLTDDVLLRSGDICDQVEKLREVAPKFWAAQFQREGATQIYKSGSPANTWKFGDNWPSDLGQ